MREFIYSSYENSSQTLYVISKKGNDEEKMLFTCLSNWDKRDKTVFEIVLDYSSLYMFPRSMRSFSGHQRFLCDGRAYNFSDDFVDIISFRNVL